jgi:methionyl-tRNA formyltransferase
MTDLPYGRGGSPLQNLIIRGHDRTMISAIKCTEEIDAGPVYLKKELSLAGSAKDIFLRANHIIKEMILEILLNNPTPKAQKGKVVKFKRRNAGDGNLKYAKNLNEIYNYIRMLDADGYPHSFISHGNYLYEFSDASIVNNEIIAKVKIKRQKND